MNTETNYTQVVNLTEEEMYKIYMNEEKEKIAKMLISSNKALNLIAIPTAYPINTIQSVSNNIATFSDEVFGIDRPFTAPLHHMKKEVDEAIESGDKEEFADLLLLLLDAYRKKFPLNTTQDLLNESQDKIEICKSRKWSKPDENGVIEHIR